MSLLRFSRTQVIQCSKIYDQNSFYSAFISDVMAAEHEVVIESPFLTTSRIRMLQPYIESLTIRGIKVIVNTKSDAEQDVDQLPWFQVCVAQLQAMNIIVLQTVGHHRKIAIIDQKISWEGSLNILSFRDSCEMMRRFNDKATAKDLRQFLNIEHLIS